jgi:UDP:flavonoid glycosyltransferase YjiC (YdhE family)
MATLAHGLPSVLLPLGADQPHNAVRAEQLGLARTLDAATVTRETIRETVEDALRDESITARARRMAEEFERLPGVEATVPMLEALHTATS